MHVMIVTMMTLTMIGKVAPVAASMILMIQSLTVPFNERVQSESI